MDDDSARYLSTRWTAGTYYADKPSAGEYYDKERKLLLLRICVIRIMIKADEADRPSLIEVNVAERKMTREVLDAQTWPDDAQAEPKRLVNE